MAKRPAISQTDLAGNINSTRSGAVYDQIRQDITMGKLAPGTKLRVEAMCERYGVGATPLREALSRLSAEELVERSEQRGFSVSVLDWSELPMLRSTRCDLESIALRQSIENRNQAWEDELALLVHKLGRTPRSLSTEAYEPSPAWEQLHQQFHRTLLSNSPSRWLKSFCDSLAEEAYRFRQIAAGRAFTKRNEHDEHRALFEAAIEGRADDAVALLIEHYTRTSDIVMQSARENGHTPGK